MKCTYEDFCFIPLRVEVCMVPLVPQSMHFVLVVYSKAASIYVCECIIMSVCVCVFKCKRINDINTTRVPYHGYGFCED